MPIFFLNENDEPIDLRLKYHLEGIFDLAMWLYSFSRENENFKLNKTRRSAWLIGNFPLGQPQISLKNGLASFVLH